MPTDIGTDEAQRLLRDEDAFLLEVLPHDEYEEEHIAGAESIPLKDLTPDAIRHIDRARPVIVYCDDDL
ncbi:MAG TPA: rhodanese-like domain-containing protein [Actinomycetota bacterium]|jgi:rhodanese-related sulfurtransferase|nr:rhodanese-like domain-containing protein [Actinomycetota bacterium]